MRFQDSASPGRFPEHTLVGVFGEVDMAKAGELLESLREYLRSSASGLALDLTGDLPGLRQVPAGSGSEELIEAESAGGIHLVASLRGRGRLGNRSLGCDVRYARRLRVVHRPADSRDRQGPDRDTHRLTDVHRRRARDRGNR